jgi:hypothetical protein
VKNGIGEEALHFEGALGKSRDPLESTQVENHLRSPRMCVCPAGGRRQKLEAAALWAQVGFAARPPRPGHSAGEKTFPAARPVCQRCLAIGGTLTLQAKCVVSWSQARVPCCRHGSDNKP